MNAVTKLKTNISAYTKEEYQLIRHQMFPDNLSDEQFKVFLGFCQRRRLDPIQRQVNAVSRKNNSTGKIDMSIQTSIDGYRAIAARTGQYAGSDDAVFDSELQPKKATVTVYKIVQGMRCPFTASARWDQYCPKQDAQAFMWKKMPHVMLGKCAEALALRKAFPEDLGGIETDEEMYQAEVIEAVPSQQSSIETAKEVEEQDSHVKNIAKEEAPTADDLRMKILNKLIGKDKPFKGKILDAKKMCEEIVKKDFNSFTIEDCQIVLSEIEKE